MLKMQHLVHPKSLTNGGRSVMLSARAARAHAVKGSATGTPQTAAKVQASFFPGAMNGQQVSTVGNSGQQYDTMMAGIVSDDDHANLRFYRDIYRYDNTAGSAADLLSILPFSEFDLVGVSDERNRTYTDALERLNLKTAFVPMSIEWHVTGKSVSTLLFNPTSRKFTELMPHRAEDLTITPAPFFGTEPSIEVKQSETVRNFLNSDDPRFRQMMNTLHPRFLQALAAPSMTLDANTTLYIPRMAEATCLTGMSFFKRVLPIYLIEKALYRGTLVEAQRRQRSLLHLAVGDEEWEATGEELQAIVSLFQQADLDPLGAIIATRNGVTAGELRNGGDFWKYTDMTDALSPLKLRALGISETFLSGEANYANMEVNLSVFLDSVNANRDTFTYEVFYNKTLPIIAVTNGFMRDPQGQSASSDSRLNLQNRIADRSKLDLPQVQWKKKLRPEGNKDYVDTLTTLEEKGLPIGLRLWAAAGGLDAETVVSQAEAEADLRKRVKAIKDGGEGGEGAFASVTKPRRMVARSEYPEYVTEVKAQSKTGKPKYIPNQRAAVQRIHTLASAALNRLAHTYQTPSERKAK